MKVVIFLTHLIILLASNSESILLDYSDLLNNGVLDNILCSIDFKSQNFKNIEKKCLKILDSMNKCIIIISEKHINDYKCDVVKMFHKIFLYENKSKKILFYIDKIFEQFYDLSYSNVNKNKEDVKFLLKEFFQKKNLIKQNYKIVQINEKNTKKVENLDMSNLENKIFINKKGNYSTNDIPQVLFNDESANNNVSSTSKNNLTKNNSNSLKEGLGIKNQLFSCSKDNLVDNVTDNKTINSKEEVKNLNTILPLCKIKKDFQIFKYLEIFDTIKYFELKLDIIFQDHSYSLTKYLYMCYESGYDQFEDTIFNNTEKNVLKSFTNFTDIINKIKTDIIYIIEEAKTELLQHILN